MRSGTILRRVRPGRAGEGAFGVFDPWGEAAEVSRQGFAVAPAAPANRAAWRCLTQSELVRQTSAAPTIAEIGTPVRTHWLAAPGAHARRNPQRAADRPARLPLNAMDPRPPHCRRPNPRGCIRVRFRAQQRARVAIRSPTFSANIVPLWSSKTARAPLSAGSPVGSQVNSSLRCLIAALTSSIGFLGVAPSAT